MYSKWLTRSLTLVVVWLVMYSFFVWRAEPAPKHVFFAGDEDQNGALVIAHQGGDGLWPGNTMYAFERAVALGVDMLEMDMHSSADGVLVLMHDHTVERTTNGSGEINSLTLAQIKQLDAGYDWSADNGATYPYRGQGVVVPTVEELFTTFPDMRLNIEIKQVEPSIGAPFCDLIRAYNMRDKVLVGSFNAQAMNEFRQACPEIATSAAQDEAIRFFILHKLLLSPTFSPTSHSLQLPPQRFGIQILSPRFIQNAQKRNLKIYAWTINDTQQMQQLLASGIDGIVTDYPDRLIELQRQE